MIEVANICKRWGKRAIFTNLSFSIEVGGCYGILGANGSGKTTLIQCLSGEIEPDEGTVWFHGQSITSYRPRVRAQMLSVLNQESFSDLPYTVEEVVLMGRYPYQHRWPWNQEQDYREVERTMIEMEIDSLREQPFSLLSGGEKQRVLLARVLVQATEVLLLDEPMNHLDIQHQLRFLAKLQELRERHGLTIVIVLHDLNLAAQFCEELLFLAEGNLLAQGTAHQLFTQDMIKQVYGVDSLIVDHPTLHVPQILLQSGKSR